MEVGLTAARDFIEDHLAPTTLIAHTKLEHLTLWALNLYGYVALSQSTSFLTVRTFEVSNNPQVYGSELFLGFICGIPKQMSSSYGAWEPCWKESTLYKEQVFWEVLVVCR